MKISQQRMIADILNEFVWCNSNNDILKAKNRWKEILSLNIEDTKFLPILEEINTENIDLCFDSIKKVARKYHMRENPFTGSFCCQKDYEKSYDNYYRQSFEQKWGYPPEWDD